MKKLTYRLILFSGVFLILALIITVNAILLPWLSSQKPIKTRTDIHAQTAWLTDFPSIRAAIMRGDPVVNVGNGDYQIPAGQGLVITTPNQRIIGQSDRGVRFTATANRRQMGTKGVFEIRAPGVEIGNMILTQSLDQKTHRASDDPNTYMVAGIWSEGDNYYLHDLHIDKTSYGLQLWKGTSSPGLRRIHRVLVTNWGYNGTLFNHSGYAIYIQTPHDGPQVRVEIEDFVAQNGTDIGIHDYASFNMPGPRILRGVAVMESGNPSVTGGAGDPTPVYLAKAANLEIQRGYFMQMRPAISAGNKIGYGSGIIPERFVADDIWILNDPAQANTPFVQNANFPVWQVTNLHNYYQAADRPSFSGLKTLGSSWGVVFGPGAIPSGWEKLPGSIAYPVPTANVPAVTIVRRSVGGTVPTLPPLPTTTAPSTTPVPTISSGPNACMLGDANQDGKISLADFETWRRVFKGQ